MRCHPHQGHGYRFARGRFQQGGPGDDGGRFRRGGGRAGRLFDYGELRYVVLALIEEKPRHGYEIIKAIEDRSAATYSPSPGVIYPTLTLLEEIGHATVTEADGKKLYAITPEGSAYLAANRAALDAAMARIDSVRAAHGGGLAPEILRASENLRLAFRLRRARGPLTEEQVRKIAEAFDAAALAIERS